MYNLYLQYTHLVTVCHQFVELMTSLLHSSLFRTAEQYTTLTVYYNSNQSLDSLRDYLGLGQVKLHLGRV